MKDVGVSGLMLPSFDGNGPRELKGNGELLWQVDPKEAQLDRAKEIRL